MAAGWLMLLEEGTPIVWISPTVGYGIWTQSVQTVAGSPTRQYDQLESCLTMGGFSRPGAPMTPPHRLPISC